MKNWRRSEAHEIGLLHFASSPEGCVSLRSEWCALIAFASPSNRGLQYRGKRIKIITGAHAGRRTVHGNNEMNMETETYNYEEDRNHRGNGS